MTFINLCHNMSCHFRHVLQDLRYGTNSLAIRYSNNTITTMIELVPLLLSTFLMTLHGAGAAPGYNETEIGMTIILSEEQKGIIYGTYGTTTHNGNAIR